MNWGPGTLWKRYAVALILIMTVLTVSHVIESDAVQKARENADVINLSAKQRMRSQQIVLFARMAVTENSPEATERLTILTDEFEAAHQLLMADATREASLGSLYMARTPSTDEIVVNFISLARDIPVSAFPRATFDELEAKGAGIVLERLDEAVSTYDSLTRAQSERVHRLQEFTLVVVAVVLLLQAIFIFLPAQRSVRRGFQELRAMAEADPLTGLKNRAGFDRDMAAALSVSSEEMQSLTLILLDLDDFKGINDRYGHLTGDAVLKRIGKRIERLPHLISVARIGGDEFAILVDNTQWESSDSVEDIRRDMRDCMRYVYRPIESKGMIIDVSGSVGLSRYPQDAAMLKDLNRNASASLLDAKRTGRGTLSIYNSRIDDKMQRRRAIQSDLMSGQYKKDVSVHFQPIVDVSSQKIKSVEALARWHHDALGPLNPELFLTIARDCGLGHEIESHIRALALEHMTDSMKAKHIEAISLNVSPIDLATQGFAESLLQQFAAFDVGTEQVWIEVTETERLTSRETVRANLETLNQAGVRIALDDYGVGYSNIQRLAELPIQRVKIDKSIIGSIETDPKFAGVFRSSVQMARALGADVVAEGVETDGQLEVVNRLGCKRVQGYLFYKPMPARDCIAQFDRKLTDAA